MTDSIAHGFEDCIGAIRRVSQDSDGIRIDLSRGYEFDPEEAGGVVELLCVGCQDASQVLERWRANIDQEFESVRLSSIDGQKNLEVDLLNEPGTLGLVADDVVVNDRPYNIADLRHAHEGQKKFWGALQLDWVQKRDRLRMAQLLVQEEIRRHERKAAFLRLVRPAKSAELIRARALLVRVQRVLSPSDG